MVDWDFELPVSGFLALVGAPPGAGAHHLVNILSSRLKPREGAAELVELRNPRAARALARAGTGWSHLARLCLQGKQGACQHPCSAWHGMRHGMQRPATTAAHLHAGLELLRWERFVTGRRPGADAGHRGDALLAADYLLALRLLDDVLLAACKQNCLQHIGCMHQRRCSHSSQTRAPGQASDIEGRSRWSIIGGRAAKI